MKLDKDKIKQSLSIEQVFKLVESLGGEPRMRENYFISRTICHNPPHEGSFKLYYYANTQLFKCFTECNHTFDLYELIIKIQNIDLIAAIKYIINFFNIQIQDEKIQEDIPPTLPDWNIFNKYEINLQKIIKQKPNLKEYDDNILNNLPHPRILNWEQEGISPIIMEHRYIRYNPITESIIIPHFNINGQLIGIRERTLIQENEIYGKYKPSILNGVMYNHPLSFNLYNLNNSKDNIKQIKKAIVFESEKATMQYASIFGEENDISVAVCGNVLTQYQINLLTTLGATELIIAFDKQFKQLNDNEHKQWCKKLHNINQKYSNMILLSFIFDTKNKLQYKMSPIEMGADVFIQLFKERIFL